MASEKQIAADRRNAQKSTGPRTEGGKSRSRMNAFRHGFASAGQGRRAGIPDGDGASGYKYVNAVDIARSKILSEIDDLLLQPPSEAIHRAVRRLGALERYAARNFSEIKRRMQKLE
jgi:hypothetical protein